MDEKVIVALYRLADPKRRGASLFIYAKNTSATKAARCIVCGEWGPTYSSIWPKTMTAINWEISHRLEHERKFREKKGI